MRQKTRVRSSKQVWKGERVKKTKSKSIRKILWWLKLGVVVLAIGVGAFLVKEMIGARWNGKERLTVVTATPSITVVSFDPASGELLMIEVADEVIIDTAYGYGEYRAGALARLDEQEKKGGRLLEDSLLKYLGVEMDGYMVKLSGEQVVDGKEKLVSLLGEGAAGRINGQVKTNLSMWDVIRLTRKLASVRQHKINRVRLAETSAVKRGGLPDGSTVLYPDMARLETLSREWFINEVLSQEGVTVLVVNGTRTSGLAGILTRILTTAGVVVVGAEDSDEEIETSRIEVSSKAAKSETVNLLKRVLKLKGYETAKGERRAEITVILGRDFGERMMGK